MDIKRFKEARIAKNITQGQLAAKLGVSRTSVVRWENAERIIPSAMLNRCAEIFGCTTDWLFGRT